eukprot:223949-Pleurochrysis_carterae.AAC.1
MLLLLPTGQSVRVPYCPGSFIVSNENWSNVTFPCCVMFNDSLKRNDELAVAVLDYSRVNPKLGPNINRVARSAYSRAQ